MPMLNDAERVAILDRARKLLALSRGNVNPHEATAARDKAQALLLLHGLTEDDVRTIGNVALGMTEGRIELPNVTTWQQLLAYTIARFYACTSLPLGNDVRIIGRASNVLYVLQMYDFIAQQMADLPDDYSFLLGAANRVRSRLVQMRGRWVHSHPNVALRTRDHVLIQEYIKQRYPERSGPRIDASTPSMTIDSDNWNRGFAAGGSLRLDGTNAGTTHRRASVSGTSLHIAADSGPALPTSS